MYLAPERDTKDSKTVKDLVSSSQGKVKDLFSPCLPNTVSFIPLAEGSATVYKINLPSAGQGSVTTGRELLSVSQGSCLRQSGILPPKVRDPASDGQGSCLRQSGILPPTFRDPASVSQGSCLRSTVRDPASDNQGSFLRQSGILPPTFRDPASDIQGSYLRQSGILPPTVRHPASDSQGSYL